MHEFKLFDKEGFELHLEFYNDREKELVIAIDEIDAACVIFDDKEDVKRLHDFLNKILEKW